MTCLYTRYCASVRLNEGRCWARILSSATCNAHITKRSVNVVPLDMVEPLNGLQIGPWGFWSSPRYVLKHWTVSLCEMTLVYWAPSPVVCCYGGVSSSEQSFFAFVHLLTFFLLFILFTHLDLDPILSIYGI